MLAFPRSDRAAGGGTSCVGQEGRGRGVGHKKAATRSSAIKSRFAKVNGVRLHYLTADQGAPVILLHGYAQTSHMWKPLVSELDKTRTVIAPDLRGFGHSAKHTDGYDKKTMAQDVRIGASTRRNTRGLAA
jgi:alpha-beta hydrolase superfamily lysophospholipase